MVTMVALRKPLLSLVLGGLCISAVAQQRPLWQIGKFDDSSGEFRDATLINYTNAAYNPIYIVGRSKDALNWPRFQPGPANGLAGGRSHPFTIRFNIVGKPIGVYHLRIVVLYETPRLSNLQLDVNGHTGLFFFHPKLDYAAGDWEGTFVPQTSHDEKTIDIPAAWLREGANQFILTALDTPSAPQNSLGDIAPGSSGLVYDALSLSYDAAATYNYGAVTAKVLPTIFYKTSPKGLTETVQVFTQNNAVMSPQATREISLTIAGVTLHQPLVLTRDFGESRTDFDVPEWTGTTQALLSIGPSNFPFTFKPQKKWTLHIVANEHLDIGFTDYRAKVAELQSESIDDVLKLLPQHPDFRWNLDGSWIAEQYLAGRSPASQNEFLDQVRKGRIVIPAQFANQHTGVASLEGLIRSLYPSHELAARYHLPLGAANITDVPSYSWSYATVLHDAGQKYLVAGSNNWRAPILLQGSWNEKSPFYWEGPDGSRVLMWYSRAYLQLASLFGSPPMLPAVEDALPVFLQAYDRDSYLADSVILFGSQLENTSLSQEQVLLPAQWSKLYAYPRFDFSTFADAMQSIARQFGDEIPVVRGDFGPYWEDGFTTASAATAIHRQNQQRILTAEKMGTLPSLLNPALRPDDARLQRAWHNGLLFDEHTWTSVAATTQPESDQSTIQLRLKTAEVTEARDDIEQSIQRGWAQLESFLAPTQNSIVVFNSLNWPRGGWVEADLPVDQSILDSVTGLPPQEQILSTEPGTPIPGFGGVTQRIRFRAEQVPALGYKLYTLGKVVTSPPRLPTTARAISNASDTIDTRFYTLRIDPTAGAIRSLYDKVLHRELVDTHSPFRFGAYVYTTGADDMPHNSLYRFGTELPAPKLHPIPASHGRVVSITRDASGVTITLESSAPNTPLVRTVISLPATTKRIDLSYHIRKSAVLTKEAVYIAFPLASDKPQFSYESQNGFIHPATDELLGGSREWYTVQHWAAMTSDDVTTAIIPLDAPLINFGDIVRGNWPSEFHPTSASIFSWLMSNYWGTNFPASQGGDFDFRYSIVSQPSFNPAELTRLGWEAMTPLESNMIGASVRPTLLPATQGSLLALHGQTVEAPGVDPPGVDTPNIVVITWKRAEDGRGSILRLEEIAGTSGTVRIESPFLSIDSASLASALEDPLQPLAIQNGSTSVSFTPFQVITVRIHTTPRISTTGSKP
jgi:alpha-mannosidase